MRTKVLIVDDDAAQRRIVASILSTEGHETHEAESVPAALEKLQQVSVEVVLTDLRMPGPGGLRLLQEAVRLMPAPEVVVITAFGSVDTAVEAMRRGAYDYLTKPLDKDELILVVQRAAESAAAAAVDAELLGGGDRRAFVAVTLDDVPGDEAFTDELVALHRRLYGSRPEPSWTAEVEALWSASAAEADAAEAWRTTLAALLQDPLFVSY